MSRLFLAILGLLAVDAEHFQKLRQEQDHCYSPSQFVALMAERKVHEELRLTPDQVGEARKASRALVQFDRENRGAADEQQAKKIMEEGNRLARELSHQMLKVLTKEQVRRVNQIAWQGGGEFAIGSDRELIKELALTDAQVAKMDALRVKLEADSQAIMQGQPLPNGLGERLTALRKLAKTELRDVLTAEQAAKYKELLGPPFDQSGLGRQEPEQ